MARWVGHQPPWGRWRARADRGPVARLLLWPLLAVLTVWERLWYTERPPFPRPNIADHETLDPQWKLLDSNWRFLSRAFFVFGPPAHILKNIWQPVVFLAVVAGVCERWGFHSEKPLSGMAAQTFSMCSFVLSLVLSVRLRVAFDKWQALRNAWAALVYGVADLTRRAACSVPSLEQVAEIRRWGEVWALCSRAFVGRLPALPPRVDELLTVEEAAELRAARKARHFALQRLRALVVEARRGLVTTEATELSEALSKAQSGAGTCKTIRDTAFPLVLRYLGTGLIELWLLTMAIFGIDNSGDESWQYWKTIWVVRPIMVALLSICMLGVDEAASQMEDPIKLVALDALLVGAMGDSEQAVEDAERHRAAAARGRPTKPLGAGLTVSVVEPAASEGKVSECE